MWFGEFTICFCASIASNFLAFGVKNDLKTEAEVKAELEKL